MLSLIKNYGEITQAEAELKIAKIMADYYSSLLKNFIP